MIRQNCKGHGPRVAPSIKAVMEKSSDASVWTLADISFRNSRERTDGRKDRPKQASTSRRRVSLSVGGGGGGGGGYQRRTERRPAREN